MSFFGSLEPKHVAYRRLVAEGRYVHFLRKKQDIKAALGGTQNCGLNKTEVFYMALKFFPPLESFEDVGNDPEATEG